MEAQRSAPVRFPGGCSHPRRQVPGPRTRCGPFPAPICFWWSRPDSNRGLRSHELPVLPLNDRTIFAGRLSGLSCVAAFRIATAFTPAEGPVFPGCQRKEVYPGQPKPGGAGNGDRTRAPSLGSW